MSEAGKTGGSTFSPSAVMGGVGGLLSGVVGAVGLLAAQPDLITVVVPVDRLERVVEEAKAGSQIPITEAPSQAESTPPADPQVPTTTTQPIAAPPAGKSLQGDLSAALVSIAEIEDAFLANVRLVNNSAADVQFSGRIGGASLFEGDFTLADQFGGFCRWRIPGSNFSLGSLGVSYQEAKFNPNMAAQFKLVGPGQSTVVMLKFNKTACDNPLSGAHPATLSGTLLISEEGALRATAIAFEDIAISKAQ